MKISQQLGSFQLSSRMPFGILQPSSVVFQVLGLILQYWYVINDLCNSGNLWELSGQQFWEGAPHLALRFSLNNPWFLGLKVPIHDAPLKLSYKVGFHVADDCILLIHLGFALQFLPPSLCRSCLSFATQMFSYHLYPTYHIHTCHGFCSSPPPTSKAIQIFKKLKNLKLWSTNEKEHFGIWFLSSCYFVPCNCFRFFSCTFYNCIFLCLKKIPLYI